MSIDQFIPAINEITGLTVIWENQGGIRPSDNYVTIDLISISKEINDYHWKFVDDLIGNDPPLENAPYNALQVGYRDILFSINCFKKNVIGSEPIGALGIASAIQNGFASQNIRERFHPEGAIIDIGSIQNISFLNVDDFEQRATIDLTYRTWETAVSIQKLYMLENVEPIQWTNKP